MPRVCVGGASLQSLRDRAAKILLAAGDLIGRLCLATAVSDEAEHSEVFARYAIHTRVRTIAIRSESKSARSRAVSSHALSPRTQASATTLLLCPHSTASRLYRCSIPPTTEPGGVRSLTLPACLFDQTHPSFGPSAPNQRSVITFFRV
jgi:hypothetical protein